MTNQIDVAICDDASDATKRGYFYRPPVYLELRIQKAVVVKKGTDGGNSTVDLIMVDEDGQRYVATITSRLLRWIPAFSPDNEPVPDVGSGGTG